MTRKTLAFGQALLLVRLDLVSYLTLPVGSDPDDDGVPSAPVPMVLLVHGGPWERDSYGFNATVQHLANRGYGVLQVNFADQRGLESVSRGPPLVSLAVLCTMT